MLDMIKNILVDYDDTINDTRLILASKFEGIFDLDGGEIYHKFMRDIHMDIIHKKYPKRHDDWEFQGRLLCEHLGLPYDNKKIDLLSKRFNEAQREILESPKFFSDAIDFLDGLAEEGFILSLSSGKQSKEKDEIINRVTGKHYFKYTLGSEVVGYDKIQPEYYKESLKIIEASPEETLSIGDNLDIDIYPAVEVGIKTLWLNRRQENENFNTGMKPDYEATDLNVALKIIKKMG
jgi:putative hydrolase of the HAD superfamily